MKNNKQLFSHNILRNILFFLSLLILIPLNTNASEPITPIPKNFPYDKDKALLGKQLFFDTTLSKDFSISCASCHDPSDGGVDHERFSTGVNGQLGGMNSPSVLNAVFNFRQFWNGRANDLREQAAGPIQNPVEMAMTIPEVEKRLNENDTYKEQFTSIYKKKAIEFDDVIDAIVEFEKALTTPDSKFDRYLRGEGTLKKQEKNGYLIFKQYGCVSCHNGINVGGSSFQYFGAINPYTWNGKADDRYKVTGEEFDKNRFKVPTLRNVENTAPYFHDGSAETLEDAVMQMGHHNLGVKLSEEEVASIISFLKTLTGQTPEILQ